MARRPSKPDDAPPDKARERLRQFEDARRPQEPEGDDEAAQEDAGKKDRPRKKDPDSPEKP